MNIQHINAMTPIKLLSEEDDNVYLTHSVVVDTQTEPFGLLCDYTMDDKNIHVFPVQYNKEFHSFESVPREVAVVIEAYIKENPIKVLTKEQIEEVAIHE
jgi:hypothetical protein